MLKIIEPDWNLSPYLSKEALEIHYHGHHLKYVENLQKLLPNCSLPLEEIISKYSENTPIYNNAAQILNHNIFWQSMKKDSYNPLILEFLNKEIEFEKKFILETNKMFGSGWVWLVSENSALKILSTKDGIYPKNCTPIINIDLWEHAYYVNYQNKRTSFCETFIKHLLNYEQIERKLLELGYSF